MGKQAKCRCDACGAIVTEWIGMVCVPCHDAAVRAPLVARLKEIHERATYDDEHEDEPSEDDMIDALVDIFDLSYVRADGALACPDCHMAEGHHAKCNASPPRG